MTAIETHRSTHLDLAERHIAEAIGYLTAYALDAEPIQQAELKQIATRLRTEANNVSRVRASGLGGAA